jgi:UDP-N-acetyl-D-mannosaminuronate dehydrogenase
VDEVVLAGRARRSLALTAEVLRRCDVVVIAAAHRSVDYDLVLREAAAIVDARNALRDARNPKVVRL